MRCLNSSPLVEDCIFRDNVAENKGGGIYGERAAQMVIRNCTFLRNEGSLGGGAAFLGSSHPRLEACHFVGNEVGGLGGAFACEDSAAATLVGSTIEENRAGDGGGVAVSAAWLTLIDCLITRNRGDFGGAVSCLSGTVAATRCTLSCDTALYWGGAMHCIAGSLLVSHSLISSNYAVAEGGAVNLDSSAGAFDSCRVVYNLAGESFRRILVSGGFYLNYSSLVIHGSEIAGNGTAVLFNVNGSPPTQNADAIDNWWGDDSGPYHPTLNPEGLGDRVSDYVDFVPWQGMTTVRNLAQETAIEQSPFTFYPNPFGVATTVTFALRAPGQVHLSIYDIRGRLVRTLLESWTPAGTFTALWDGTEISGDLSPPGTYFCCLETDFRTVSRKIILLR